MDIPLEWGNALFYPPLAQEVVVETSERHPAALGNISRQEGKLPPLLGDTVG